MARRPFPAYVPTVYPSVEGESRNSVADEANAGMVTGIGRAICIFLGSKGNCDGRERENQKGVEFSPDRSLFFSLFFHGRSARKG